MTITITTIEASAEDLMANRRVADALTDAISRMCDAIARPVKEQAWEWEEEGDSDAETQEP